MKKNDLWIIVAAAVCAAALLIGSKFVDTTPKNRQLGTPEGVTLEFSTVTPRASGSALSWLFASASAEEAPAEQAASAGLTIDIGALSAEPEFIDWDQDGTAMQIIALKDSSGAVQLAYNTCQVCAGSPYAYFEYSDGVLMCMNCGNRFGLASVGKASGGCNPKPLAEYQVEGDAVVISEETLAQAASAFQNCKVFQ